MATLSTSRLVTHLSYSNFAPSHTSTAGSTVGLSLAPNPKYCTNCTNYPQGISFHDSAIVAFDDLVFVRQTLTVDIHDNVLDYAGEGVVKKGPAVQISRVGGGL